jgi:long-chain fatty acid transport protein
LVVFGWLAWSRPSLASPQDVFGFGHRSIGMGGTGSLAGATSDTVYGHPAVLSTARESILQFGLLGASFDLRATGPGMPGKLSYLPLKASTLGAVLPLPFGGVLRDRLALGVAFLTPLDVVVRGRILYPETPQFLMADRTQSIAVYGAIGADLGHGVRIGGGVSALAALRGSVLVATDESGRVGTRVEDALVASYAPLVSVSYDLDEAWRLGATYRGELRGRFNVVIEVRDLGGITVPPLNISGMAQYDPAQLTLEATRSRGHTTWGLSATYAHWAAYPGPLEATVRCEDAPDPDTDCLAPAPSDPEFSPTVTPRVGGEYRFDISPGARFAVRAGYAFVPSPAPEQTGRTNFFDAHRSVASVGWGWLLDEPLPRLSFDGFVQLGVLHARDHRKRVDLGALRDATIRTAGTTMAAGVAATVKLR